jgi:hypothetical protein
MWREFAPYFATNSREVFNVAAVCASSAATTPLLCIRAHLRSSSMSTVNTQAPRWRVAIGFGSVQASSPARDGDGGCVESSSCHQIRIEGARSLRRDVAGCVDHRRARQIVAFQRKYQQATAQSRPANLHISRRIRFSGEIWLNRLDDRPQSNSQTIAQGRSFKL